MTEEWFSLTRASVCSARFEIAQVIALTAEDAQGRNFMDRRDGLNAQIGVYR
jgi:hypothetical protein